jgi:hypothetical protein
MPGNTPPAPWMSTQTAGPGPAPKEVEKDANEGKEWLEIEMVDYEGEACAYERYCVKTPSGKTVHSRGSYLGRLKLVRLAKGNCTLSSPSIDDSPSSPARRPTDKIPTSDRGKRSKADKIYVPGKPLSLVTGKKYRIELPRGPSFWLELTVRHRDAKSQACAYVLRSKDGKYEVRRTRAEDLSRNAGANMAKEASQSSAQGGTGKVSTILRKLNQPKTIGGVGKFLGAVGSFFEMVSSWHKANAAIAGHNDSAAAAYRASAGANAAVTIGYAIGFVGTFAVMLAASTAVWPMALVVVGSWLVFGGTMADLGAKIYVAKVEKDPLENWLKSTPWALDPQVSFGRRR